MTRRLRIASPAEGQPETGFADAAHALLDRALADGAGVLLIAWETQDGTVAWETVPKSDALGRGFCARLDDIFNPPPSFTE